MIFPPEKDTIDGGIAQGETSEILEKPLSKEDQVSASTADDAGKLTLRLNGLE